MSVIAPTRADDDAARRELAPTDKLRVGIGVAVPRNRPASLAHVTAFIEEAKASGVVRKAATRRALSRE